MADVTIKVGAELDASWGGVKSSIDSYVKSLEGSLKKIKVGFDTSGIEKGLKGLDISKYINGINKEMSGKKAMSGMNAYANGLTESINQMTRSVSEMSAAAKSMGQINFDFGLGKDPIAKQAARGIASRDAIAELENQRNALSDYLKSYYKAQNDIDAQMQLARGTKHGQSYGQQVLDQFGVMLDKNASLTARVQANAANVKLVQKMATEAGVDLSSVTNGFDKSADKIVADVQKIQTGEQEAESAMNRLKAVFQGAFDTAGINNQLSSITELLNQFAEGMNTSAGRVQQAADKVQDAKEKVLSGSAADKKAAELTRYKTTLEKRLDKYGRREETASSDSYRQLLSNVKDVDGLIGKVKGGDAKVNDVASQLSKIKLSAEEATNALQKMVTGSDFSGLTQGTSRYNKELERLSKLHSIIQGNGERWDKAKTGKSSDAYYKYLGLGEDVTSLMERLHSGEFQGEGGRQRYAEELGRITSNMARYKGVIEGAGEATKSFGSKVKGAFARFGQYFGVSRIIFAAAREIKEMARASIEVESAMNRIQIVTGASDRQMSQFFNTAAKQARELGQSITDVAGSIETFSRLGYNLSDAANLSRYATIMSNVADTDVGTATTGITSIIKGYGMQASDAERVSDVLVQVGQKYAISAEELMTAFERGGAALAASGTDFEKSAALFAATNASLQNAQTTGTMWKTVSARIRGAKTELEEMGEDTTDLAEGFSKYRDELKALTGVDIMKNEDEYKDLYDIFTELAHVWDNINGDEAKARVAEILGGTRQLSGIMSTITNIKDAEGAYADAMDAAGTSARANAKYMETTAAHIGQLKATFQEFSSDFFDSSFLKGLVDAGNTALKVIDTLIDKIGVLGTIASGVALYKLFDMGKATGTFSEILGLFGIGSKKNAATKLADKKISKMTGGELAKVIKGDAIEGVADSAEAAGAAMEGAAASGAALYSTMELLALGAGLVVAAFAAFKVVDYITKDWERNRDKAQASIDKYKDTQSEIESINSEMETTQTRINELDGKTLNVVERRELENLKSYNKELEQQRETLQTINNLERKQAYDDAVKALQTQTQWSVKDSTSKAKNAERISAGGSRSVASKVSSGVTSESGTIIDKLESDTRRIEQQNAELKKQQKILHDSAKKRSELEDKISGYDISAANGKLFGKYDPKQNDLYKKDKKALDKQVDAYETAKKRISEIQGDITSLTGEKASDIEQAQPLIDMIKGIDPQNPIVKRFNAAILETASSMEKLDVFFDGSASRRAAKDYLKRVANSTRGIGDLKKAMAGLGLSLEDVGASSFQQLKDYLTGVSSSLSNATKNATDFRKSVSDIEAAAETPNKDKDWTTIQGAYKTAKELLKAGKTGTDDFQVFAQFASPDDLAKAGKAAEAAGGYAADEYQKAFESQMKTLDRWFGEDQTKSMEYFVKDMQSAGLFDVREGAYKGLWDIDTKFKSTAEAAKAMGKSVGVVEAMIDSLEAYGYNFSEGDNKIIRSAKLLDDYTDSLDRLKELQSSMSEGSGKDRVGRLVDEYQEKYEGFKKDLTGLDEDMVIHIQFEYDLAEIQNEIDQVREKIEWGDNTSENWAELITGQRGYVEKARDLAGLNVTDKETGKGVPVPAYFDMSDSAIKDLQGKMKGKKGDAKLAIQAEISNELDIQKDFLNKFNDLHPNITPNSNFDDAKAAWDDFMQVTEDGKTITINAEMNKDEVDRFFSSETNKDKTIRFTATIDGDEKIVEATKDKNGVIHYTTEVDDKNVELVRDEDGTIHYKADTSNAKPSKGETQADGSVKYKPNTSGLPNSFSEVSRKVKYKAETSGLPTAFSAITRTVKYVASGIGKFFGIGGADGTAHASGTTHKSGAAYARGDWRTRGRGTALGGELGPEMVVRNGRWFTIGDSGAEFFKYQPNDIIFDADQTDQLLNSGRIKSGRRRGNALAEGTAFRLGGSSSSYKKTGRSSGGGGGGGGSSSSKTDSVLDKFKAWLAKLFDWVEVKLERIATRIDDAAKRAERAASAGNIEAAVSNYNKAIALSKTQLSNAQSAKAKYDAQAEAVLNKAVKDKVISQSVANTIFGRDADGSIDINEYDDRTQEVISAYMAWKDKARDAADEIEAMSEDITGYYESIAEAYKEVREKEIDLIRQQSDNTETAAGKNSLLESIASKYDDITSKIKAAYSNVDSIAKSNASTLSGANINNNMTSTLTKYNNGLKNTVKSYMQSAIDAAKAGKPISGDVLSTLTEYHRYGYISSSFYAACVQYNNALDAKEDLQGQLEIAKETAKQEKIALGTEMVDNISKELQRKFDKFEASKDLIESRQKTNKTIGYDLNASDYNTLIDYSRQQQALLTEEKRAIDAAIARNLALGLWNTSTPEYIEKQIEVEELASKIQDCVTAQEEYNNAIMQLPYDTIEHALSLLDAIASYNESISDLKEAEGVDRLESDYLTQIEDNSNKIEEYLKKRIQAYADYERALANGGAIGGKRAEEYLELYYEANTEINKLKEANEELKDSLRDDVWWRTFDRAHEAAQRLLDVVSGIADLISDDMYFKDGALSEFGIAQVANLTKQYELARQEIENYSNDILNLNDLYTDGYYTTEEYKEKLGELQVELLNSAKDMKGYLEEIMSMYKEIDEQELKALLSLIDKRRDALKSKKDYYDYDKTIRGKTKDIKELTAQIAALEGITTAEAKAQKAKLQAQLQEAQEDLEKTQTEHHFDLLNKGLDELKDTFQNEFDEKWENLAGDLAKMAELLTAANELATQNTEQVINTLNNLLSFYGIDSARTKIDQAFASGTKRVNGNIVGLSNESGSELLVTKHGIVSHFKPGEGVVPPDLTARLFNLAQQVKPNTALGKANINGLTSGVGASITQNYGSLINIEGSADAATVADLKRMSKDLLEKSYNYTSKRMTHDYVRTGGLRRA